MVNLTFSGKRIIAQFDPSAQCVDNPVRVCHSKKLPEFDFHFHPQFELALTMGSQGKRLVGDNVSVYNKVDLTLVGPYLPHTWACQSPYNGDQTQSLYIQFTRESLGMELLNKPEFQHIKEMLHDARRGIVFSMDTVNAVKNMILDLPGKTNTQLFLSVVGILDLLASKREYDVLLANEYHISWSESDSILFQKILDYIWSNYSKPFTREEVAKHAGLSVSTFSRFFKRMTGTTFVAYVNEVRLQKACHLLQVTGDNIFDIGFTVGFKNSSYFTKQFRSLLGMTPSKYREQKKNETH